MIMVQKITYVAYALHDGKKNLALEYFFLILFSYVC